MPVSFEHADVVRARRPGQSRPGLVLDEAGVVLGAHDGIERFTVGQRKGLGIAGAGRRYVLELLPESGDVVLGERAGLLAHGLLASGVNWLGDEPRAPLVCAAKIRYRHTAAAATVTPLPGGGVEARFVETQSAVTPGQAVVFYDGDRVLGGGWIERALA